MDIEGVNDFLKKCFSLDKHKNDRSPDKEHHIFFRGETKAHEQLLPSIYYPCYKVEDEKEIFNEIIATFSDEMLAKKTTIEKLIFMRHYELPTRVLDLTKNPLVALFFACYEEYPPVKEKDGIVHVFSVPKKEIKFCESDSVCLVANICKQPADFSVKEIRHLNRDDFNAAEQIQYLIHDARQDKPGFQNVAEVETIESVICLHPLMNNERVRRQNGYFFLYGIDGDKKKPAKINKDWIGEKITIPQEVKKRIREELELLHINASTLLADYKNLARDIQARYKKLKFSQPYLG
jgi:hypothetical protein